MAREIRIRGSNYYRYLQPRRRWRPPGTVVFIVVGLLVLYAAHLGGKT